MSEYCLPIIAERIVTGSHPLLSAISPMERMRVGVLNPIDQMIAVTAHGRTIPSGTANSKCRVWRTEIDQATIFRLLSLAGCLSNKYRLSLFRQSSFLDS